MCVRRIFIHETKVARMHAGSGDNGLYHGGRASSACLPNSFCDIPFVVVPLDNDLVGRVFNFGSDCYPQDCCITPPVCPLNFLSDDTDYIDCDTDRTCERSGCCDPNIVPHMNQPVPPPQPPVMRQQIKAQPTDYKKVVRTEKVPSQKREASQSRSRDNVFKVEVAPREEHLNRDRIPKGASVWMLNGVVGARVNLKRNRTYTFEVIQSVVPGKEAMKFFFSRDIAGPSKDDTSNKSPPLAGTSSTDNGIIKIKIDESYPNTFYYHSSLSPYSGGMIVVHDE